MTQKRSLVIITDCVDIAFNELYHTVHSLLGQYGVDDVDIAPLVPVRPFSIVHAAFSIRLLAEHCLPGTVFLAVINGTPNKPERIFGRTKNGLIFVGNNSGYFNWMLEDFGLDLLYKNKVDRESNSQSFGGKRVGAPTAAKIMAGIAFDELGERVSDSFLGHYEIPDGTVVHCDNFGLMKIKHDPLAHFQEGQLVKIYINGQYRLNARFFTEWKSQREGEWVLFPGSSFDGMPELGRIRSKNSAAELQVVEGDRVAWIQCENKKD